MADQDRGSPSSKIAGALRMFVPTYWGVDRGHGQAGRSEGRQNSRFVTRSRSGERRSSGSETRHRSEERQSSMFVTRLRRGAFLSESWGIRGVKCVYRLMKNSLIRCGVQSFWKRYPERAVEAVALLSFAAEERGVEVERRQRLVRSARLRPCWATFLVLGVSGRLALVVSADLMRCVPWVCCRLPAFCLRAWVTTCCCSFWL